MGIPFAIRSLIKSNKSKALANLLIVVDSPPGITKASISTISSLVFTGRALTPQFFNADICSRKSP